MAYKAENREIFKLLNDTMYRIPRNQRKYVWQKQHWKDLFLDVVFASENEVKHFVGSIVLKQEDDLQGLEYYTIIDGQQRMMTITIFIVAIMFIFKVRDLKDDFEGTKKYLVAKNNKNEIKKIYESDYHLSLGYIIDELFSISYDDIKKTSANSFISGKIVNKKRDKLIGDCLKLYIDEIMKYIERKKDDKKDMALVHIRDTLIKMSYVSIVATSEEDSYTIFEILNARGQSLEDHELLRNYIMRYIQPVADRDKVKSAFENIEYKLRKGINAFVKHYAPHMHPSDENNRKEPYKHLRDKTKGKNIDKLFEDIQLKASYYSKIYNPVMIDSDGEIVCSDVEYKVFKFFKSKRQEQFRPVLLSLMHQYEIENINEDKYNDTLIFLYNFFICYHIIGKEKSNRLTDMVYKYAPLIENDYSDEVLCEFVESLKSKIPNEIWFVNAFSNLGWSRHRAFYKEGIAKKKVKLVLELFDKHLRNSDDDFEYTIEHILPDSDKDSEENATIANLIPLELELNKRCDKKPLEEKIKIYRESSIKTVKEFVKRYDSNKEFKLQSRKKHLAKIFYNKILKF